MSREGVRTIFTFQVDNPLARVCRPELLGHHALAGAEMSSVVVRKIFAEEKMGVIARVDGHTAVVEYSDLPDALAAERDAEGELVYWAGSIAVHCIEVELRAAAHRGRAAPALPPRPQEGAPRRRRRPARRARTRRTRSSSRPSCSTPCPRPTRTVTVEAAREDEFSPIKNAEGADSPASCPARPEPPLRALARGGGRGGAARRLTASRSTSRSTRAWPSRGRICAASLPPGFAVTGPTVIP